MGIRYKNWQAPIYLLSRGLSNLGELFPWKLDLVKLFSFMAVCVVLTSNIFHLFLTVYLIFINNLWGIIPLGEKWLKKILLETPILARFWNMCQIYYNLCFHGFEKKIKNAGTYKNWKLYFCNKEVKRGNFGERFLF